MKKIYKVVKIKGKGKGVIATREIKVGTVIMRFEGKVVPWSKVPKKDKKYALGLGGDFALIPENEAKFVNHSCDPNCEVFGEHLIAIKDIKAGQELTFAYDIIELNVGKVMEIEFKEDSVELRKKWKEKEWTFECQCGSKNCRRMIDKYIFRIKFK